MAFDNSTPTGPQVQRTLETMLQHSLFLSRTQPARVLDLIVRRAIDGNSTPERIIREQLFPVPPYEPDTNIVRITVDALRHLLEEYNERCDDLVLITLPRPHRGKPKGQSIGEGYRPRFEYNSHHSITKDYVLAWHLMQTGSLMEYFNAQPLLYSIVDREPNHAGAWACLADNLCMTSLMIELSETLRLEIIALAGQFSGLALYLAPNHWRSHSSRALYHCCNNDYDLARKCFDRALELDQANTETQTIYGLFLLKSEGASAALQFTEHLAQEQFRDANVQCHYGLNLYGAKRYAEAETVFQTALRIDRNCWMAHLGAAYVHSALGHEAEAQKHAKRLEILLDDPIQYNFWISGMRKPPPSTDPRPQSIVLPSSTSTTTPCHVKAFFQNTAPDFSPCLYCQAIPGGICLFEDWLRDHVKGQKDVLDAPDLSGPQITDGA